MNINLTTLISSAITSVINGIAVCIAVRYMSKAMDTWENGHGRKRKRSPKVKMEIEQ